jgi:hypothetical protein
MEGREPLAILSNYTRILSEPRPDSSTTVLSHHFLVTTKSLVRLENNIWI